MPRRRATLASLFLLSLAVLLMEVCLTRVFSVISWHHFAYLIISLALLGFGAAGSYLTVSRRFAGRPVAPERLGQFAWLFSLTAAGAIVLISRLHFYPLHIVQYGDYSNALSLLLMYVAVGIPFFFAGVCIGRLIATAGENVNLFYFADLLGAGVGALAALAVINQLGAVAGVFVTAAVAAAAACALGADARWRRWAYRLTLAGMLALAALTAATNALPLYTPPSKEMYLVQHRIRHSRWHVAGRIDVGPPVADYWSFGGALSRRYTDPPPEVIPVYQDGAAPTGIMRIDPPPEAAAILGEYLQGVAYTVRPADAALIIGVGGGVDALIAMHHGARKVVGVDLNPVTVSLARDRYRQQSPALWADGRFTIHVAEGRHYLTRTGERFDVIQLSGVDTFAALASGAYALAENFLYTREAMRDYWDHLTDEGILSFSRWLFDPPRETLRLVTTQRAMLDGVGVAEPEKHFVIIAAPAYHGRSPWAETLLKRTPFTPAQAKRLIAWAQERQFDVLYDPYHPRDNPFDELLRASPQRRKDLVADCCFNIAPTTDDDPFFFQWYRWGSLLGLTGGKGGLAGSRGGYGITRVPLSFIILAVSLVQMIVLSGVFIIAPLWMGKRLAPGGRGRFGVFVYFAALGLGFMFIEIAVLQKLTVFVGGPVYSMAITLASLLLFSGVGSFLARAFRRRLDRALIWVILALAAVTVGEMVFFNHGLRHLMGLPVKLRWLAAAGAVLPLGLLLGMPFPTALRIVTRIDPATVPWAWGVNACATVLGGMLCVLLSIHAGFTASLAAAVGIYLVGAAGMAWAVRRNRQRLSAA